jgi:cysteinyl-tRNA synthetase
MSKSKGEFLTLALLENKGYKPLAYRFFCLGSHYRNQLIFSYNSLDTASASYDKLLNKVRSIETDDKPIENQELVDYYKNKFKQSLEDNLNTSNALTTLFEVIKDEKLNNNTKRFLIQDFDKVLSLDLLKEETITIDSELKSKIETLIAERNTAKSAKDYARADEIRNELASLGVTIKDGREGTTYTILEVK